ncbi:hypothetical protein Q7P37_001835 [Cladosporium fusiforme]
MTSGPNIVLAVPKPPSKQQTDERPDETLAWIRSRICELMCASKTQANGAENLVVDHTTYSAIYSSIAGYVCARSSDGSAQAVKVYRTLEDATRQYCEELRHEILGVASPRTPERDTSILRVYVKEWKRYCALARMNAHLFSYLDRHWIRRALDANRSGISSVWDLHMMSWRQGVVSGNDDSFRVKDRDQDILAALTRIRKRMPRTEGAEYSEDVPDLVDEVASSMSKIAVVYTKMADRLHAW